jgi:hypothetical protein
MLAPTLHQIILGDQIKDEMGTHRIEFVCVRLVSSKGLR